MSFLPQADLILVLADGEVTEMGSYQELLSRHGAFADFIRAFASSERKEIAVQRGEWCSAALSKPLEVSAFS